MTRNLQNTMRELLSRTIWACLWAHECVHLCVTGMIWPKGRRQSAKSGFPSLHCPSHPYPKPANCGCVSSWFIALVQMKLLEPLHLKWLSKPGQSSMWQPGQSIMWQPGQSIMWQALISKNRSKYTLNFCLGIPQELSRSTRNKFQIV